LCFYYSDFIKQTNIFVHHDHLAKIIAKTVKIENFYSILDML
jgi:hypothetical protein